LTPQASTSLGFAASLFGLIVQGLEPFFVQADAGRNVSDELSTAP
jgi:hypothetical protein